MSPSQRRALASRLSATLVFGLVLVSAACQRRPGSRPAPASEQMVSDGYAEKSREQAGGGVHSVSYDDTHSRNASVVEELLIGRFAGVDVQRTADGGYSVSIRGVGSFLGSEQPLFVIDGIPVEVTPGRGLSWLNPADVARIDVLKNPSEISIYGVRGANGVIVITTKRPR